MTTKELSHFIQEQASQLGFDAVGFARAERVPDEEQSRFQTWLKEAHHGEMSYMERNLEKRMDPRLLVEGCRSVLVVALNYFPSQRQKDNVPKVAKFAYGMDYHTIIRGKLYQLLEKIRKQGIPVNGRAFSDSAPVFERYWAWKAGLGWLGKNQNLIIPGLGSFFLLGELMVDIELEYSVQMENKCGNCEKCLSACPTKALEGNRIDARKCLSYLTIEKKGSFSIEEEERVGENDWVFGCDICQDVCPWNRFSKPHSHIELEPKPSFLSLDFNKMQQMNPVDFHEHFSGTCLQRAGFDGFQRNLSAIQ